MPLQPEDVRRPAGVTRRTAVGGGLALGVAAVAGCTDGAPARPALRPRETVTSGAQDPDVALAATVLADEQRMLDRVLATVERHPGLASALAGAQAAHVAHVALLTDAVPEDQRPRRSPGDSASASPSVGTVDPGSVARKPAAALAALARAEDRLALVGRRSALAARSGAFARAIASMAASAAQQASLAGAAAGRAEEKRS